MTLNVQEGKGERESEITTLVACRAAHILELINKSKLSFIGKYSIFLFLPFFRFPFFRSRRKRFGSEKNKFQLKCVTHVLKPHIVPSSSATKNEFFHAEMEKHVGKYFYDTFFFGGGKRLPLRPSPLRPMNFKFPKYRFHRNKCLRPRKERARN